MQGYFCSLHGRSISKRIFIKQFIYVWISKTPSSSVYMEEAFPDILQHYKSFSQIRSRNIEVDKNTGSPSEGRPVNLPTARN